jgi:hypothetical protein
MEDDVAAMAHHFGADPHEFSPRLVSDHCLTAAAATAPQAYAAVQGAIASWIGQVVLFGSPQVDHAAIDFQIDFVQMPGCVRLGPAFDSIDPNRTKLPREFTRLSVGI